MPLRVKECISVGARIAVPRSVMECFVRNPNSGAWLERRDGRSVFRTHTRCGVERFYQTLAYERRRGRVVDIDAGYGLDDPGFECRLGQEILLFPKTSTQRHTQRIPEFCHGGKAAGA